MDLFCNGEPSAIVWRKYIEQNYLQKGLVRVNMRSKKTGWSNYNYCFEYEFPDHSVFVHNSEELYMRGYLCNLYTKPACAICKNKTIEHDSDISLGDFWGVNSIHCGMDDNNGCSAVIIHTHKGLQYFTELMEKNRIEFRESSISNILKGDNGYIRKNRKNPLTKEFLFECTRTDDINGLIEKYLNVNLVERICIKARKCLDIIKEKVICVEACTGCTACKSVCRKGAIRLIEGSDGFLKPEVDKNKCIGCVMCIRVCNYNTNTLKKMIKN